MNNYREAETAFHATSQSVNRVPLGMVVLLNIRGNCSHLEAKSAHMVGHLPSLTHVPHKVRMSPIRGVKNTGVRYSHYTLSAQILPFLFMAVRF